MATTQAAEPTAETTTGPAPTNGASRNSATNNRTIRPSVDHITALQRELQKVGYYTNDTNLLLQLYLLQRDTLLKRPGKGDVAALVLDGPPGCGKTFGAESFAKLWANEDGTPADMFGIQFTVGVSREVMMSDLDIAAIVSHQANAPLRAAAGELVEIDPRDLLQPGVLEVALENSRTRRTVLLLDEIDKAKPYIDSMLLQFLQDCAIAHPTKRGEFLTGNPQNLVVFITKNNERGISEPLIRRCRSVYLSWPGPDTEVQILKGITLAKLKGWNFDCDVESLAKTVVTLAKRVRDLEALLRKVPSSPELAQLCVDVIRTPKEYRGMVAARGIFKYREDFEDFNKQQGAGTKLSEEYLRSVLHQY